MRQPLSAPSICLGERPCPRFHWYGTSGSFDLPRGVEYPKLPEPFRPRPKRIDERPLPLAKERFVLTAGIDLDSHTSPLGPYYKRGGCCRGRGRPIRWRIDK